MSRLYQDIIYVGLIIIVLHIIVKGCLFSTKLIKEISPALVLSSNLDLTNFNLIIKIIYDLYLTVSDDCRVLSIQIVQQLLNLC